MAYFVSSAVQTNLSGWDLMPLPKALASAAQQAIATINTKATNQTRGGQATNTTVSPGASSLREAPLQAQFSVGWTLTGLCTLEPWRPQCISLKFASSLNPGRTSMEGTQVTP